MTKKEAWDTIDRITTYLDNIGETDMANEIMSAVNAIAQRCGLEVPA